MSNQTPQKSAAQAYADAGLIYIRALSKVETKADGKTKKIKANPYPKDRNLITEQPKYNKGSGDYYALLMGREFLPGLFVLLLDFDNKDEEGSENWMKLLDKLQMDSRGAPCQKTPFRRKTLPLLRNRRPKRAHHSKNNNHLSRRQI